MAIDLDAAIHDAEAQLAELDRLREAAVLRLAELTQRRAARDRSAGPGADPSPVAKARLFGDLFRGRDDVFAVRWENLAKGRSGYSPRCANEWRPGVCAKPKVRCGACDRHAFVPLMCIGNSPDSSCHQGCKRYVAMFSFSVPSASY